ncbi:MAG: RNA 3'-terminal phosphate cyclase [Acidobacteriota bacterium]
MMTIDGSAGEGGGQILRTSLALSLVTGKPFKIERIRAGRKKPGLMRQHLTAVRAAAEVGGADVEGDAIGSMQLTFAPSRTRSGDFHFAVGTAGSCTLVLQTVLPALLVAGGASDILLEGGTHNPFAPPFDFLAKAFLPIVNRMGARVDASLERPGFYPAGGGRMRVSVQPGGKLTRVDLTERGEIRRRMARAAVAMLPRSIGERELRVAQEKLSWPRECYQVTEVDESIGPGNVFTIEIESEHVTELFTGFGEKGQPAETVAGDVVREVREYLAAGVPVGRHLADQLLIPMALAGGGCFRTLELTRHTTTNIEIVRRFLDVEITVSPVAPAVCEVEIGGR